MDEFYLRYGDNEYVPSFDYDDYIDEQNNIMYILTYNDMFGNLSPPTLPGTSAFSLEEIEKINKFYKYLEDNGYEVDLIAPLEHGAEFEINADNKLTVKYKNITFRLMDETDQNLFLSPIHVELTAMYGEPFVKNVLGIINNPRLPQSIEARIRNLNQHLPQPRELENISPQDFADIIDRSINLIEELEISIYEAGAGPEKKDMSVDTNELYDQNIRDMKRANKFFNSVRGQIAVAADKISNYDEQIARLKAERERVSFNREDGVEINEEKIERNK